MIGIKGGVVTIGRNDKIAEVDISECIVVVDIENKEQLTKEGITEWLRERVDDNVSIERCKIMSGEQYAAFVLRQCGEKTTPRKKRLTNMGTPIYFTAMAFLLAVSAIVPMFRGIAPVIGAVLLGSFAKVIVSAFYRGWKDGKKHKAAKTHLLKEKQP